MVLEIYQSCNTAAEFRKAFDKLDRTIEARRNQKVSQLRSLLLVESSESKGRALDRTKQEIDHYLQEVEYWSAIPDEDELDGVPCYLRIDNWGDAQFGGHGLLFIGAFCNGQTPLFPVLLLCDENGDYIDFTENDILSVIEQADDFDIHYFHPTNDEMTVFYSVYERLTSEMEQKYLADAAPIIAYNRRKVENWIEIQTEQLNIQIAEVNDQFRELNLQSAQAKAFLEKLDIKKKAEEKKKQLLKLQESFHQKVSQIHADGEAAILEFNKQFEIHPFLVPKVVLKY